MDGSDGRTTLPIPSVAPPPFSTERPAPHALPCKARLRFATPPCSASAPRNDWPGSMFLRGMRAPPGAALSCRLRQPERALLSDNLRPPARTTCRRCFDVGAGPSRRAPRARLKMEDLTQLSSNNRLHSMEASRPAICYVRFTSIPDVQSLGANRALGLDAGCL